MLATLGGTLALLAGLAVLLLPLLALELSRPRDSVWGALILLLGLVLVTSADRLRGSPMLAVLCGGLLIGRLGLEVGQARWRQLSPEERQRLWSPDRWREVLEQLITSIARLVGIVSSAATGLLSWPGARRRSGSGKRWVRPELPEASPATDTAPPSGEPAAPGGSEAGHDQEGTSADPEPSQDEAVAGREEESAQVGSAAAVSGPEPSVPEEGPRIEADAAVIEVRDFTEVDALLRQSSPAGDHAEPEDTTPPGDDGTG